ASHGDVRLRAMRYHRRRRLIYLTADDGTAYATSAGSTNFAFTAVRATAPIDRPKSLPSARRRRPVRRCTICQVFAASIARTCAACAAPAPRRAAAGIRVGTEGGAWLAAERVARRWSDDCSPWVRQGSSD